MTTDQEQFQAELAAKLGTAEQAIAYALDIDDHYDMRQFLSDWQDGTVAVSDEYEDYWDWLKQRA